MYKIILFVFASLTHAQQSSPRPAVPSGSWEAWIQAIRSNAVGGLPGRPDRKSLDAELPLWVDCALSFHWERQQAPRPRIAKNLILNSDAKACEGQLEGLPPL